MAMKLQFCGGAQTVTGACYYLEINTLHVLVDCGLFQGEHFAESRNEEKFLFDPREIDYVFLTHAHADHIGRLPKLVDDGFKGIIIATAPTRDLVEVMLADSAKVMMYEAQDHGTKPLYTQEDVAATMRLFRTENYNQLIELPEATSVYLRDSAHILGSCMVEINADDTRIVFTGDLGNPPTPLLANPYSLEHTDYLVMESVYGDRVHEGGEDRKLKLERLIEDTYTKKGVLIIPAFALERTQELLAELNELVEHNRVPAMPIFIDSPLAYHTTEVYKKHISFFNPDAQAIIRSGDDLFNVPGLKFTVTREESKMINDVPSPKIIITGNPHGYGSRISHHFLRYLSDPRNTVLFVGYQQPGSIGRKLVEGEKEVRVMDHPITVNASISHITGYSSHADQNQLRAFLEKLQKPIKTIFVAMGEPPASNAVAQIIRDEMGVNAVVPQYGAVVELD